MINRQMVLEYLDKHPSHSTWQMRLHFLQATRQIDAKSSISISSIANQLNYVLRDLEAIGKIPPHIQPSSFTGDRYRSDYPSQQSKIDTQEHR
jgi:hypothetical protein